MCTSCEAHPATYPTVIGGKVVKLRMRGALLLLAHTLSVQGNFTFTLTYLSTSKPIPCSSDWGSSHFTGHSKLKEPSYTKDFCLSGQEGVCCRRSVWPVQCYGGHDSHCETYQLYGGHDSHYETYQLYGGPCLLQHFNYFATSSPLT
jgi:hypothetical protein